MSSEKEILLNIEKTIDDLLNNIYNAKSNIIYIKRDIHDLDNNYFIEDKGEIYSQLVNIFDSIEVSNLTCVMTHYKNIVEHKLNNICKHEWVDDHIDISPDSSQSITYCRLCEISKKN
jgi:glucose-6-phosphate-specific signal transduction histidine kinase